MCEGRVKVADPYKAVRGWTQDYWMLRLLDQRGLDVTGPGGPYDLDVGPHKAQSRWASFFKFAERLASLGWVIIWRTSPGDEAKVMAVPVEDCVVGEDTELQQLGGLVGVALGLPWGVARPVYMDSIAKLHGVALVSGAMLMEATGETPPAYGRFLATSEAGVAVLVRLIDDAKASEGMDLDSLLRAAEAASVT